MRSSLAGWTTAAVVAGILQGQFDGIHTFVYHPHSALLVAADGQLIPALERLISEYRREES